MQMKLDFFFKCTPDKTLHVKGEVWYRGKRSKVHNIIVLCKYERNREIKTVDDWEIKKSQMFH